MYFSAFSVVKSSFLSRWPAEIAATEKVHVEVRHGLSATVFAVEDEAITIVQAQFDGELRGHEV